VLGSARRHGPFGLVDARPHGPPPHGETSAVRRAAMAVLVRGLPGEAGPLSMVPPEMRAALPAGAAARIMMYVITGRYRSWLGCPRRRRRRVLRARYYVG